MVLLKGHVTLLQARKIYWPINFPFFYNASLCNQCGVLTPYLKSGTCIYTVSLAMFLPATGGFSYAQMCLLRLLHPLLLPQMHHTRTRPRDDLDL